MSAQTDEGPVKAPRDRIRRSGTGVKIALVATGLGVGAITASALAANAATSSTPTTSSSYTAPANQPGAGAAKGKVGGSAPVRSDEKAVSATLAAKLKAAALKALPGGTVYRVETDAGDGTYEAHMTKSDGTLVTVKFDRNLTVTKVESGMGTGDPAPKGGNGGPGGRSGPGSAGGSG
ncbi:MAG: hypothetical protein ACRDWT_12965 [Jatrophihabitantaceae bacterium]